MAQLITITHTPPTFTPVYTDGLFFTITTITNYPKFRFVYDVVINNEIVFSGKATPNPFGLGVVDVSRILKNYVSNIPLSYFDDTPIYTNQTFPFSRPLNDNVIPYLIRFGYEYAIDEISPVTGFTGNGELVYDTLTGQFLLDGIPGSPSVSTGTYKTFQSTMGVNGRATQQDFDITPFILQGTPQGVNPTTTNLFLTNSPRFRDIQPTEYYTLGFTNYYLDDNTLSEPYYVEYNFYDDDGALIETRQYQNFRSNGGGPMDNCNYKYTQYYVFTPKTNTDFNTLYVGAGPENIPNFPPDTAQYTVQLFGSSVGPTPSIPSPSATPTPTPTPSVVPCSNCFEYYISNISPATGTYQYRDCFSKQVLTQNIPAQTSTAIPLCVCEGSFIAITEGIIVTLGQPCGPKPCTTCFTTTIYNNNAGVASFYYYNCTTNQWTFTSLQPGSGNQYCTCLPIVTEDNLQVIVGSVCSAPAPSPTPSPSCLFRTYNLATCLGGTCSNGICSCKTGNLTTLYAPCSVTDPYVDGALLYTNTALTNGYNGAFTNGSALFVVVNGVVSFECIINGPC
jgi:hypothetical protein